ncbi:MAG: hypothetical protein FJW20_08575 [Acidimicrobiia bacterium]|nr:hypothetical protein [Acidimicrobiia bacterium]
MNARTGWALLAAGIFASRLAHLRILWVEECYPAAAAIQILHGKLPYRDFFFDKPPLSAFLYLLWGGYDGWPLRLAGTLFILLCCWLLHRFALELWSPREASTAAILLAFFLTFDTPSAVIALAPDMLLVAPHIAAVWMAFTASPVLAGLLCAAALLLHTKAVFVIAICAFLLRRRLPAFLGTFLLASLASLGLLAAFGMLEGYRQQVWLWGLRYAADTFLDDPLLLGLKRTAGWLGFHAALLPGLWLLIRNRDDRWLLLWLAICLAGVAAGWRFFPRYYFLMLPALTLAGARGLALLPRKQALAAAALLLVPLARFAPRYFTANDPTWADTAMNRDSRQAAAIIQQHVRPGDTLLVWGYRPDLYVYTRLPAATPFLDSQPLTGVIADRHLTNNTPTAPGLAASNRRLLLKTRPTFIADGLGPYNPALRITVFQDLLPWLASYRTLPTTRGMRISRLNPPNP